jgi:hypothetical protein
MKSVFLSFFQKRWGVTEPLNTFGRIFILANILDLQDEELKKNAN